MAMPAKQANAAMPMLKVDGLPSLSSGAMADHA
jgi:hypothetical protein